MDLFVKSFKRCLIALMLIGGFYCSWLSNYSGSIKPMMAAVLLFGLGYLFAYFWHRYKRIAALTSLVCFAAMPLLAYYLPFIVYVALGYVVEYPFFIRWPMLEIAIGMPLSMLVLNSLD